MQKSHAVSPRKGPAREASLDSPYAYGHAVLSEPALVSRKGASLPSVQRVWVKASVIGVLVFVLALTLQWIVYDRFLHENGIRIVGSAIAATIAIMLVVTLGMASRRHRKEEIARLETIALLNHHIRNALQAIISVSGSTDSTNLIRSSVERIEWALGEVLPDLSGPPTRTARTPKP